MPRIRRNRSKGRVVRAGSIRAIPKDQKDQGSGGRKAKNGDDDKATDTKGKAGKPRQPKESKAKIPKPIGRKPKICPRCRLQLPLTGRCDTCSR